MNSMNKLAVLMAALLCAAPGYCANGEGFKKLHAQWQAQVTARQNMSPRQTTMERQLAELKGLRNGRYGALAESALIQAKTAADRVTRDSEAMIASTPYAGRRGRSLHQAWSASVREEAKLQKQYLMNQAQRRVLAANTAAQKTSMLLDETAEGLQSQISTPTGYRLNPSRTNLYVREYGSN
jgi:hypothetical protein